MNKSRQKFVKQSFTIPFIKQKLSNNRFQCTNFSVIKFNNDFLEKFTSVQFNSILFVYLYSAIKTKVNKILPNLQTYRLPLAGLLNQIQTDNLNKIH